MSDTNVPSTEAAAAAEAVTVVPTTQTSTVEPTVEAPEAPTEAPPTEAPAVATEGTEAVIEAPDSSPVDQWNHGDYFSPECDGCKRTEDNCVCGLDECWHCGDYYDPETSGWSRYCSGGCASDDGYFSGYARHASRH